MHSQVLDFVLLFLLTETKEQHLFILTIIAFLFANIIAIQTRQGFFL